MPGITGHSLTPDGISITFKNGNTYSFSKAQILALFASEKTKAKVTAFIQNKLQAENPLYNFGNITFEFDPTDGTPLELTFTA